MGICGGSVCRRGAGAVAPANQHHAAPTTPTPALMHASTPTHLCLRQHESLQHCCSLRGEVQGARRLHFQAGGVAQQRKRAGSLLVRARECCVAGGRGLVGECVWEGGSSSGRGWEARRAGETGSSSSSSSGNPSISRASRQAGRQAVLGGLGACLEELGAVHQALRRLAVTLQRELGLQGGVGGQGGQHERGVVSARATTRRGRVAPPHAPPTHVHTPPQHTRAPAPRHS